MGGTDSPENLVELTIQEHAQAHYDLWKEYGKIEDKIAWKGLSRRKITEEDRIELSKSGFSKFINDPQRKLDWTEKIKNKRKEQTITESHKNKISEGLKKAYKEGRKVASANPEISRKNYHKNNMSKVLSEARKTSTKWKESVTSEDYRLKKSLSDPRSKKVSVNGSIYNSIRHASKETNIPYSKLRNILVSNINNDIFFC
jgi:hypothetical protein